MAKEKRDIMPVIIAGAVVGVLIVVLVVMSVMKLFRTNPYGDETRIDNFGTYYSGVPQDEQDLIYYQLYTVLAENVETVPEDGALVREGTADYDYDGTKQLYYGNFVVDVPAVRQSYRVQFEWTPVNNGDNLGGYPVLITCVPANLVIYEGSNCVDNAANTVTWKNEYQIDYSFGERTSYKIREILGEYMVEKFAGGSGFVATVDEISMTRMKEEPDVTYGFSVKVNDSKMMQVVARTDPLYGNEYIAIYVSGDGGKAGFVVTNNAALQSELGQWVLKMAGVDELGIKYEEL